MFEIVGTPVLLYNSSGSEEGVQMVGKKTQIVKHYARMWPREVFYFLVPKEEGKRRKVSLGKGLDLVNEAGVYVLYRDDIPYYIGQAAKLRHRLWTHACA